VEEGDRTSRFQQGPTPDPSLSGKFDVILASHCSLVRPAMCALFGLAKRTISKREVNPSESQSRHDSHDSHDLATQKNGLLPFWNTFGCRLRLLKTT
jgi:hypothetical protein